MKYREKINLEQIKALARHSDRLVYAMQTCWWKVGDPIYRNGGLPSGPRGEMLMETDDPIGFIDAAEKNPAHYGKHGLRAFVAAYHGNLTTGDEKDLPTSLRTWKDYETYIDALDDLNAAKETSEVPR